VARTSIGGVSAGVRGTSSSAGGAVAVQRDAARRVADAAVAVAAGGGSAAVDGRPGLIAVSSHLKMKGDSEGLLTSVSW
jgi:tellurite resistance protein